MRDRSKQLLVINTGKKESEQTRLPAQSGTTHIIGGGGLSANMSDYLLKSIWDKVWEIRTDSQGIEYIFGKLPMVTQYGITMYSGDGVDVPSLASGLPFDGRTIWYNPDTQQIEVIGGTGGGSGEGVSNFWDLSGIPSWITNSKPKYTYSEIEGTPDLTKYALVSQIPSLSGYATESWVTKQNYATKATTLSGYGITDAYTKTNVDDLLKSYVTLAGSQTITGEKNFTGGLKVNDSPIVYNKDKKYWKLEGDLLITGGITMYGNEGTYTPSTIMDAISVDGTTISKEGGVLRVIGGTGGGSVEGLASVAYSGKYDDLTGKPTLLSSFTDDVVSGKYLSLSGGTLREGASISWGNANNGLTDTSDWNIKTDGLRILSSTTSDSNAPSQYAAGLHVVGRYGFQIACEATSSHFYMRNIRDGVNNWCRLWHTGNDGSGSGLDADLLDGYHVTHFMSYIKENGYVAATLLNSELWNVAGGDGYIEYYDNGTWFNSRWGKVLAHNGFDGDLRGNASSATKLQTAITIWGQSFDGTGNVDGDLTQTKGGSYGGPYGGNNFYIYTRATSDVNGRAGALRWAFNDYSVFKRLDVIGENGGTTTTIASFLDNGNVGIGTASPSYKLDVNGDIATSQYLRVRAWSGYGSGICSMWYNGNTTQLILDSGASFGYHLNVSGDIWMSGAGITGGGLYFTGVGSGTYNKGSIMSTNTYGYEIEAPRATDSATGTALPIFIGWRGGALGIKITSGGNLLANGGITMYSDQRKKTILNHVELSLKQIANAPLIEHYYNADEKKTTHVGSIAQYWYGLNDWFCKQDAEGFLTMEIQNAALASAISIARELDRYETKTDKAIKKLKKRICELEEEVERLKSA